MATPFFLMFFSLFFLLILILFILLLFFFLTPALWRQNSLDKGAQKGHDPQDTGETVGQEHTHTHTHANPLFAAVIQSRTEEEVTNLGLCYVAKGFTLEEFKLPNDDAAAQSSTKE